MLILPTAARSPAVSGWERLAMEVNGTKPLGNGAQAGAGPTVSATRFEELAAQLPSPAYDALRVWLPMVRVVVVKLAVPLFKAAVPSVTVPSLNDTFPVAGAGDTTAVRVT